MPTAPFGDADFQAVLDGLGGVPVTVGGTTANGTFRKNDVALVAQDVGGPLGGRSTSVLVRASTFGSSINAGTSITVDGVAYKVATTQLEGTGVQLRIFLARP